MVTRTQTRSLRPGQFPNHQLYNITAISPSNHLEPTCYPQTVKNANWKQTMADELTALAQNKTCDLVPAPSDAHVIGAKWIFKLKLKADGTVERHKARLMAKTYNQQEGVDYSEIFSLVVKPATIRVVLSIALSQQWTVHQLNVNNVFLYGEL
jgi:Reverse transcriptase (RNA-dependent DNA polymerase)